MPQIHALPLLAAVLLAPSLALAQTAGGAGPGSPPAEPLSPKVRAVAVTLEVLAPLGGAGCFYRRRPLAGVLVIAGSIVGSGLMLYARHLRDGDATIVGAAAYGAMRAVGIAVAAQAYPLPAPARGSLGFGYGLSF